MAPPAAAFFLSPHADDVAFSCGGSLALEVAAGGAVTLVTVFLSGRQADERRREDEQAARSLGAGYRCLELPDAADRPEVRSSLDRFMPFGPPHMGITNEVLSRLRPLVVAPATIYAPLAVGGHVDHRVVHEAARLLAYDLGPDVALAYYEDQPYGLADYTVGRRLAALQAEWPLGDAPPLPRASTPQEVAAYRSALLAWPLVQSWPRGLRTLGCHLMARRMVAADGAGQRPGFRPRLRPELRRVEPVLAQRQQAVAAYASQWPLFAASAAGFCQQLADYGRRASSDGSVVERLYFDSGVYGVRR